MVLARSEVTRSRRRPAARAGNGGAARPDGAAARLLRAVLRLSGRGDRRAGAEGRRAVAARPDRGGARRPGCRSCAVVHRLAGGRVHGADAAGRTARRLCLRALRLPRQTAAAGGGGRAVRAADRRRRLGLPGTGRAGRAAGRAVGPAPGHLGVGDSAGARLLQLRRGRTDRRRALGAARPAPGRGGAGAGSRPVRGLAAGDAAGPGARRRGRRADGLPLHLHLLRGGADSGRARLLDAGGGDLPADRGLPGSADGRRPHPDPVRGGAGRAGAARLDGAAAGIRAAARGAVADRTPAARPRPVDAAVGDPRRHHRPADRAAGRARGAVVRRAGRLRGGVLHLAAVRRRPPTAPSPSRPSTPCGTPSPTRPRPPRSRWWWADWRPPR